MRDRMKWRTAFACVAVLVCALPALAQTGRVGGTVKDDKGQPIKGATVLAENPASSPSSFTATTDDKGRFSIIGLRSGNWKVTASAPGFQPSGGQLNVRTIGQPNPPLDFTLAPGAAASGSGLSKEIQAEFTRLDGLVANKQYDEAIAGYQAILAKTPQLTILNTQIARIYRQKRDFDSAIAAYKKSIEAEPTNDRAKTELGMTYLEKGDLALAETTLGEVAQGVNANREVFYNLGEVKFAKGETDEAVKQWERAAQVDPNWAKPYFKIGLARLQKADSPGAIEMMEKVVAVEPTSPEAAQAKQLIEQLKKGGA